MTKVVACPVCGAAVAWNATSTWRPFCSARCKTIDLGDWASERHVIAGRPDTDPDGADRRPGD
jgi:endogenous inhibitor of DNA gyrase (YacG/DUF329 family)